jgi:hypothetical protein
MSRRNARAQERSQQAQWQGASIASRQALESIAVDADRIGRGFRYTIDRTVTLPRQKSALLPVFEASTQSKKVSVYNRNLHPRFPFSSLRMKNTTKHHWQQGPLTVFEDGGYVGDARLPDLHPGQEKFVSYALDLGLEVRPQVQSENLAIEVGAIGRGWVCRVQRTRETTSYHLQNRADADRNLIVEHPRRSSWSLFAPQKAASETGGHFRFEWSAPASTTTIQPVTEERTTTSSDFIRDLSDGTLEEIIASKRVALRFQTVLKQVIEKRKSLVALAGEIRKLEERQEALKAEQVRLRANLDSLPALGIWSVVAYTKVAGKFEATEDELTKLVKQLKQKRDSEKKQQEEYLTFTNTLTVK